MSQSGGFGYPGGGGGPAGGFPTRQSNGSEPIVRPLLPEGATTPRYSSLVELHSTNAPARPPMAQEQPKPWENRRILSGGSIGGEAYPSTKPRIEPLLSSAVLARTASESKGIERLIEPRQASSGTIGPSFLGRSFSGSSVGNSSRRLPSPGRPSPAMHFQTTPSTIDELEEGEIRENPEPKEEAKTVFADDKSVPAQEEAEESSAAAPSITASNGDPVVLIEESKEALKSEPIERQEPVLESMGEVNGKGDSGAGAVANGSNDHRESDESLAIDRSSPPEENHSQLRLPDIKEPSSQVLSSPGRKQLKRVVSSSSSSEDASSSKQSKIDTQSSSPEGDVTAEASEPTASFAADEPSDTALRTEAVDSSLPLETSLKTPTPPPSSSGESTPQPPQVLAEHHEISNQNSDVASAKADVHPQNPSQEEAPSSPTPSSSQHLRDSQAASTHPPPPPPPTYPHPDDIKDEPQRAVRTTRGRAKKDGVIQPSQSQSTKAAVRTSPVSPTAASPAPVATPVAMAPTSSSAAAAAAAATIQQQQNIAQIAYSHAQTSAALAAAATDPQVRNEQQNRAMMFYTQAQQAAAAAAAAQQQLTGSLQQPQTMGAAATMYGQGQQPAVGRGESPIESNDTQSATSSAAMAMAMAAQQQQQHQQQQQQHVQLQYLLHMYQTQPHLLAQYFAQLGLTPQAGMAYLNQAMMAMSNQPNIQQQLLLQQQQQQQLLQKQQQQQQQATHSEEESTGGRRSPQRGSPLRIVVPQQSPAIAEEAPPSAARFPLNEGVVAGNFSLVRQLLTTNPAVAQQINAQDEQGMSALITATSLTSPPLSFQMVQLLLTFGASTRVRDRDGFTAAHWAAAMDNVESLQAILSHDPALVDATCLHKGDTPLHRASRFGQEKAARTLLKEFNANVLALNFEQETCIDVAGRFPDGDWKSICKYRSQIRPVLFECCPFARTVVLYHAECLQHQTTEGHQESPERINAIMKELEKSDGICGLVLSDKFEQASKEAVTRAHEADYYDFVVALDHQLKRDNVVKPVAFTPRVQRALTSAVKVKPEATCDTMFSAGSLGASLRASGAVIRAVDLVVNGQTRNAFCAVRPPGHHAGVRGLLDDATSCGFCIFNSVMIGALHALSAYQTAVRRVAIIDFDVHHGNGTQDIIRQRIAPFSNDAVLFFSIHLYDREEDSPEEQARQEQARRTGQPITPIATSGRSKYEFYPGSGLKDLWEKNIFNVPIAPLWKDPSTVPGESSPISSAGAAVAVGTSAALQHPQPSSLATIGSSSTAAGSNSAAAAGIAKSTRARTASISNDPSQQYPQGRMAYRKAVKERLVPLLRAYRPDLIFVSAGFDAAQGDVGCCKATMDGKAVSGADLKPEDFDFITRHILKVANVCCEGRVVSVLEGGYGSWLRSKGEDGKGMELNRDGFAKCVASHVLGMTGMSQDMF